MKYQDLTGKTYTWLYVEKREGSTKQNKALWQCRCICNNIVYATTGDLNSKKVTSCGCRKAYLASKRRIDEVGKTYNYLYVKEYIGVDKNGRSLYRCNCLRCNNETLATGKHLRNGSKKSCGCLNEDNKKNIGNKTFKDLTGNIYGYLLVKNRAPNHYSENGSQCTMWNCLCLLCGNNTTVAATALTTKDHTRSCGCLKMSYAEKDINDELLKFKINFVFNYIFSDLVSPTSGFPLRFDFALLDYDNKLLGLIEYQGQQHFIKCNNGFGDFQREITDKIKKDYCKNNNIKLYEICYYENVISKLHEILKEVYNISQDNSVPIPIYTGKGVTTKYINVAV